MMGCSASLFGRLGFMVIRRGAVALVCALLVSATLTAQRGNQQNSVNTQKMNDAQKKEILATVKVVDDLIAGKPGPNDLSLTWVHDDLLKAQNNKEYIPFTITFDPSGVTGGNVSLYWRVVSKSAAVEAPPAAPAAGKK